ncbi:MAG TPA: endonuclease III [Syntrophorhabdaceae bacterium]|nr:endonuclease III [Syntrophorhabdaceae bacterium]MDI9560098.1 endonuclease III [Pseudomonadota bacterium]MBP8699449.1 endonuclease III [Syntrophorhabdaceae bacterium]MBV6505540.1 Endonuclease III [Syntrophorhabdaceae bacterium]HNQ62910.1 endonuclease III [Syntrophorhabdaceae bacterium]
MTKDILSIINKLKTMHGEPRCELNFTNPLELVVATVLAAQCTDERVNRVTKELFKKYVNVDDYLNVAQEELEEDIRPTGFYRNKAKVIKNAAKEIRDRFDGVVPQDIDVFATVKGIGRKSANLIVGLAYDKPAVIVDTHVIRLSGRIGFSENKNPDRIEQDIKKIVPKDMWTAFSMLITLHGRYLCKAKKPECERCLLQNDCDYWIGGRKHV